MISVEEALSLLDENIEHFDREEISIADAGNRILDDDVFADRDFPPYDRVMMDGIAIQSGTFETGARRYPIENIQAAGAGKQRLNDSRNCIEVMTGAILPENTDVVVPYEELFIDKGVATIRSDGIKRLQNIHLKGTDCKTGTLLLKKGKRITPVGTAILAATGYAFVPVVKLPRIAVCSTGDELVDVKSIPAEHQVRQSNACMLASALKAEGIDTHVFHFNDDRELLLNAIQSVLLDFDILLFSGAVSKGKFDYLPAVLQEAGMDVIFHGVAQKPGKPFLFGKFASGVPVFGFPGNPVSTFVCYHLYFRRWLYYSMGVPFDYQRVRLAREMRLPAKLARHLLVSVENADGILNASPLLGSGSGDLPGLIPANGVITLPAGKEVFHKGEIFNMISFEG